MTTDTDQLTVLRTLGPLLTKVWTTEGIRSYDDAASFKVTTACVSGLHQLHAVLVDLEGKSRQCLIRGALRPPDDRAYESGAVEGTLARRKTNFIDQPLHACMVDIDGYRPVFGDPVLDPTETIDEYVEAVLPPAFHRASYHWQLSASAGKDPAILKAHVWFWLREPHTCATLSAWAHAQGHMIDHTVFREVQVHYTANPVFEDGVVDPVPRRSGLRIKRDLSVDLVLDGAVLEQRREPVNGSPELVDPKTKPGLIGAFCRAFTMEEVISRWLSDVFVWESPGADDRRLTWLAGGGQGGGAFVTEDREYVVNVHNTDPLAGRATNKWDLVRWYLFGHLDDGMDEFEALDITAHPSQTAMLEMVGALDEVRTLVTSERSDSVESWVDRINGAVGGAEIETILSPLIQEDLTLSAIERERLAALIQTRVLEVEGVKLPLAQARRLVVPTKAKLAEMNLEAPPWARPWVWLCTEGLFMHTVTKQTMTISSFNQAYGKHMVKWADSNGICPPAARMFSEVWKLKHVDSALYVPQADLFFELDGMEYLNLYRPDLCPAIPDTISPGGWRAIEMIQTHMRLLVPDDRERRLFLDFLAHTVQKPGVKVRWSVLLRGIEGDGKSLFGTLMRVVLGAANVRDVDSSVLEGSNFTGWAGASCFVVVEELKLQGHNRYDVYNKLKPYLSNSVVSVHPKGRDPFDAPNPMNFMMLTNFDDAIPVTANDRRVMFLQSPFRSLGGLETAVRALGMTLDEYFHRLFDEGIYKHPGALRRWLLEHVIGSEFSPNGRAPVTGARASAVDLSIPDDEDAVRAEVERGGEGVYPEILSATKLVEQVHLNHPTVKVRGQRVRALMSSLGFEYLGRVRWGGEKHRIYGKGKFGDLVATLDALERGRVTQEFED